MPRRKSVFHLIKQHPIFSMWPSIVLEEMLKDSFTTSYKENKIIVKEDEIVDSLYFITKGNVEVSRRDELDNAHQLVLATLHPGETIGLSATGLFSETGKRTATVKAIDSVEVTGIPLESLHHLFLQYPQLNQEMAAATAMFWKMQIIKQSAPFSPLSHQQLQWLVDKVQEVEVTKDTTLFTEGEQGDCCYLIASGMVEIIKNNEIISTLTTSTIFGETALLLKLPRNATARCKTDCVLLKLFRDDLVFIIKQEKLTAKKFSTMEQERSRPKKIKSITVHSATLADGENIFTLKNAENKEYFQLSEEGFFIWELMNGRNSIKQIVLAFHNKYQVFSPSLVVTLVADLARAGFVEVEGYHFATDVNLPKWMSAVERIRKVMEAEFSFPDADAWLTKTFNHFVKIFYTKPVISLLSVLSIGGIISFAFLSPQVLSVLPKTQHLLLLIILVDLFAVVSVPLHELAHAYTTKYFGREVTHFGVGWYWIGPIAFTDTSDMWLSQKWPRIIVNLAGMFIDSVIACLSTMAAWYFSNTEVVVFFWMFSLFCYLSIFHNLFPLIELDGYYTLMDLFERPHLREDAVEWLVEAVPKFTKEYRYEIIYWIICFIFVGLMPFVAWFVQYYILAQVIPILAEGYWRFLLPLIAVGLSLLSVWVEIQRHRREEKEDDVMKIV